MQIVKDPHGNYEVFSWTTGLIRQDKPEKTPSLVRDFKKNPEATLNYLLLRGKEELAEELMDRFI